MSQTDLPDNASQPKQPEGVGRLLRTETDLDEKLGLVHLHGILDIESAKISSEEPPKSTGSQRPLDSSFNSDPIRVDKIRRLCRPGFRLVGCCVAIRLKVQVARMTPLDNDVQRDQEDAERSGQYPLCLPPTYGINDVLHDREKENRGNTDAGEHDTDVQTTPSHKSVRQEKRVAEIADEKTAAGNKNTER